MNPDIKTITDALALRSIADHYFDNRAHVTRLQVFDRKPQDDRLVTILHFANGDFEVLASVGASVEGIIAALSDAQ